LLKIPRYNGFRLQPEKLRLQPESLGCSWKVSGYSRKASGYSPQSSGYSRKSQMQQGIFSKIDFPWQSHFSIDKKLKNLTWMGGQ